MRILVQNKLLPAVVPPIALGLHQHSRLPGPAPASRRTRADSPLGHGYVQLYLGKGPDTHSVAQRDPAACGPRLGAGADPPAGSAPGGLEQPRPPAPRPRTVRSERLSSHSLGL